MKIEITRGDKLNQEKWSFSIRIDYGSSCIYLDDYSQEHKDNLRQRVWRIDERWNRLDHRSSRIKNPPLPEDVKAELYTRTKELVKTLPIKA